MKKVDKKIRKILKRYEKKLGRSISLPTEYYPGEKFSRQYETFRKEALEKTVTRYESWCNFSEKIINLKASEKDKVKIEKAIEDAHVNVSVGGALSFAVMAGVLIIVFGILFLALTFISEKRRS